MRIETWQEMTRAVVLVELEGLRLRATPSELVCEWVIIMPSVPLGKLSSCPREIAQQEVLAQLWATNLRKRPHSLGRALETAQRIEFHRFVRFTRRPVSSSYSPMFFALSVPPLRSTSFISFLPFPCHRSILNTPDFNHNYWSFSVETISMLYRSIDLFKCNKTCGSHSMRNKLMCFDWH